MTPIAWQQFGGAAGTLNVKSHTLDLTVLLVDVTHTGTGGNTARIAQKADAAGTISYSLDLDIPPWRTDISITPGTRGVIGFYVTTTKFFQVPVRVEKLHHETAVENEVRGSVDVKMDALSGTFAYPAL